MNWEKRGLIFEPDNRLFWQQSHAALPTKLHLGGSDYRFYFTSRDSSNRTFVGYFDIDLDQPETIKYRSPKPVLEPGDWGFFDDHGVQACSIVRSYNGDLFLYYLGWNPGLKAPLFYTSIGLAISKDNGVTFKKYSSAPIMQRSEFDPWMVSGGTTLKRESDWIMYYLSGYKFTFDEGVAKSFYDIKIATSTNGIDWTRSGKVALALKVDETNISRLTIIEENDGLQAWFPVKKQDKFYRCGHASSTDGENWLRDSDDVLQVSQSGWDSDAIDKMEVVRSSNKLIMLYNGNNFGRDGIGLAIGHE